MGHPVKRGRANDGQGTSRKLPRLSGTHQSTANKDPSTSSGASDDIQYLGTRPLSQPSSSQGPLSTQFLEVDDPNSAGLNQSNAGPDRELYGSLETKIVGCRYYDGMVSMGEFLICRREPRNEYDPNAIRVDNVLGAQVGHFPRGVVAKMAPYIDSGDIAIEAKITGQKGFYDCPVEVLMYGTSDTFGRDRLEERLKIDKLVKANELKRTRREAAELRRRAMGITGTQTPGVKKPGPKKPGLQVAQVAQEAMENLLQTSQVIAVRSSDDIVNSLAMDEDTLSKLPSAPQPQQLESQLLPYQLQGLEWMMRKEKPQFCEKGSPDNVQLWKTNAQGHYTNLATNFTTRAAPKLLSGGILADDMGLGKTLQIISLILTGGKGPTLIVAPMTVMSNWVQQIEKHVLEEYRPTICIHHGSPRIKDRDVLGKYDVVITSYGTMTSEDDLGVLFKVKWRRVVLDEGHTIRNSNAKMAQAACRLTAESRWVLSGTPIVNTVRDLHSLLKFLGITGGVETKEVFRSVIERGLAYGDPRAESILQALMGDLCLRRHKMMKFVDLKLPPKTMYVHRIAFTDTEQKKYDTLLSEAKGFLEKMRTPASDPKHNVGFQSVLERLLRLRQMCCHWTLCKERLNSLMDLLKDQKVVNLTPENQKILQDALRLLIETQDDCCVCLDTLGDPVITHCKHAFCRKCILQVIEIQHKCPMCRTQLSDDKLLEAAAEEDGSAAMVNEDSDGQGSSKTDALLKILDATLLKNPASKVIVFSQWTSFLTVIQAQLENTIYGVTRIDGSMKPAARDAAIDKLQTDPNTRIMLASLGVCSVGLNLVAADTVVLADSWWAPAIEDQAIDRVHRLGQTRPTTVWRLVMEGTVEERVLDIQDEKRKLVSKAFQEKDKEAKAKETRMADVMKLLG